GGSGDILSGIRGALAAKKINIRDAAAAAAFIHGTAGDIAAGKLGLYSMAAPDLIKFLPEAFISIFN
ncbi:MAG: NAD(P)H-hydrate dehydratase, partial [Fibrobacterota bacterium]